MMVCFSGRKIQGTIIAVAIFVTALFFSGCTKVDNSLGDNLIPYDQQMSIRMVTLGDKQGDPVYVDTYLAQEDSIPTSNLGNMFIGSKYSDMFGYTTAKAIAQIVPSSYVVDYGYEPAVDSAFLMLNVSACSNINKTVQGFTVYEVKDRIVRDSVYYADFPAEQVSDMAKPLFKFNLTSTKLDSARVKLTVLPGGEAYLDRLINANIEYSKSNTTYQNDSLFIYEFKGLCIVPDEPEGGKGIFQISLNYSYTTYTASTLYVYGHNHLKDYDGPLTDWDATDTTVVATYYLNDASGGYPQAISSFERQYPAQLSAMLNDTLPTSQPVQTAYIEGVGGGVFTYLRFTQALVDKLQQLKGNMGMSISNATIYFQVDGGTDPAVLNTSFSRLGMFYDYARASSPIPDYNYSYENASTYNTIPYNGYLNRSNGGFYSMDISTYIQRLMDKPSTQRVVELTPSVNELYAFSQLPLTGSGKDGYRIKLKLTYSLIPK